MRAVLWLGYNYLLNASNLVFYETRIQQLYIFSSTKLCQACLGR